MRQNGRSTLRQLKKRAQRADPTIKFLEAMREMQARTEFIFKALEEMQQKHNLLVSMFQTHSKVLRIFIAKGIITNEEIKAAILNSIEQTPPSDQSQGTGVETDQPGGEPNVLPGSSDSGNPEEQVGQGDDVAPTGDVLLLKGNGSRDQDAVI